MPRLRLWSCHWICIERWCQGANHPHLVSTRFQIALMGNEQSISMGCFKYQHESAFPLPGAGALISSQLHLVVPLLPEGRNLKANPGAAGLATGLFSQPLNIKRTDLRVGEVHDLSSWDVGSHPGSTIIILKHWVHMRYSQQNSVMFPATGITKLKQREVVYMIHCLLVDCAPANEALDWHPHHTHSY